MKKIIIALVAAILATVVNARPTYNHVTPRFSHGPSYHHHGWGHSYGPRYHGGYYHHGSFWGHGGRNFWPGFVGGMVGGVVGGVIASPAPVVVQQPVVQPVVTTPVVTQPVVTQPVVATPAPVYQPTQVWVPGQWVHTVGPYGTVRTWQPGHYEYR